MPHVFHGGCLGLAGHTAKRKLLSGTQALPLRRGLLTFVLVVVEESSQVIGSMRLRERTGRDVRGNPRFQRCKRRQTRGFFRLLVPSRNSEESRSPASVVVK